MRGSRSATLADPTLQWSLENEQARIPRTNGEEEYHEGGGIRPGLDLSAGQTRDYPKQQLEMASRYAREELLGTCFQRAFLRRFLSEDTASVGEERFAEDVLRSLTHGLLIDEGGEQDTQ